MAKRICSVEGCDSIHLARGFCRKHYGEHTRKICRIKDCIRVGKTQGLCDYHYKAEVRAGRIKSKPCAVPGCNKITVNTTYCSMHRSRIKRTGDVQAYTPLDVSKRRARQYKVIDEWEEWDKEIEREIARDRRAMSFGIEPPRSKHRPMTSYKLLGDKTPFAP